ncbi:MULTISPECIES: DUF6286 domain-containing protein [unclassified Streptomyces]|uniref:DUF6286 domain-containing protein n=1 Tax=unclassified Streptomyces TaxID=2593676 RepID=UPI00081B737E|nr:MULTISPECIES: DUF6286 domain-containing protein [unclassified Streptomyces]MYQ50249.1 hypothetical protein [Streptomyces sp. SID4941]SCD36703.1 hypothetical protein GA0115247_103511 [Streptomyces sp. PalvLS-984]SDC51323.1 hypothetical protein F558DRAFT_02063 [Streptomyces sp. AmelKG-A3]
MSESHDPQDDTRRLPTTGQEPPERSGDVLTADPEAPAPEPEHSGGRAGRFRSGRRVPAVLTSLVLLGSSGLLLYDIASVRAGRPAMWWRRTFADELASRHLDDVWVLTGSAVAAALGLWLLFLALTPGLRSLLPMSRRHAGVRAALDRDAAALVLRDRAVEVAGVQSVRVRMRRRRAKVSAVSHFRELDEVRDDLDTVVGAGIKELGLARPPRLSVHVRRPKKG